MPDAVTPIPTISTVSGVVARLYFRLGTGASAGTYTIDSLNTYTSFGTSGWYVRPELADNSGLGVFLPAFVPGQIKVLVPTDVAETGGSLPKLFTLQQNYPNPFNPSTMISYSLPAADRVRLDVFNVLGQSVATLVDRVEAAGSYSVQFEASRYPSGIYFYRLTHGSQSETKKMILVNKPIQGFCRNM